MLDDARLKALLSEEQFSVDGTLKTIGGQRQTCFHALARVRMALSLALSAQNLVRIPKLMAEAA